MNTKNILFCIIFLVVSLVVFRVWFISPILSAGDSWYYFKSMLENPYFYPYSWYTTVSSNGLGGQGFAHQTVSIVVSLVANFTKLFDLGWETSSKFLFYIPYIFLSFVSSAFLIRKLFPRSNFWILTPIIFSLNTYIFMTTAGGQVITALSYSLMPLSLFVFMKLAESRSSKTETVQSIIICTILLSLQTVADLRIAFITSVAILLYLLFEFWEKGVKEGIKTLLIYAIPFALLALINSFWLIPILLFGIDPIEQLGIDYSSTEIVKFLSFASLENSIALLHPYWPENIFGKIGFMKPEFLLLPILAFSSLLFVEKDLKRFKYILFFAAIGLLGVFLGKGASEPFGNIYLWLFEHIPGFQLFRDSFKWYGLIALSFSILIPFAVQNTLELLKSYNNKFSIKSRIINLQNLFLALLILYFLFLLKPAIVGEIGGTFQAREFPSDYRALNNYLSNDISFYRILWIPNTVLFGYYSNIHIPASARDLFREYNHDRLAEKLNTLESSQLLTDMGVKYVIVPSDVESTIYLTDRKYDERKYQRIVNHLDGISWLKKDKQFEKIVVYKTIEYKDHFWCECNAQIQYKFVNPTKYELHIKNSKENDRLVFSEAFDEKWVAKNSDFNIHSSEFEGRFNSFILPEGDLTFEIYYAHQDLVDLGVKISLATFGLMASIWIIALAIKHKK